MPRLNVVHGKEQSAFRRALESPAAVRAVYRHRVQRCRRAVLCFVPLRV